MALATKPTVISPQTQQFPDFVQAINADYKAQISHMFALYGNIMDFVGNGAGDLSLRKAVATAWDDNIQKGINLSSKTDNSDNGLSSGAVSPKKRIMCFYNISAGLQWESETSAQEWKQAFQAVLGQDLEAALGSKNWDKPKSVDQAMKLFNTWFHVSRELMKQNLERKAKKEAQTQELALTIVFTDADALVPAGEIAQLSGDRSAIVHFRNWAQDLHIGARNKIILVTRHLSDIHESLRSELLTSHMVRKPNLEDRKAWLNNFRTSIQKQVELFKKPLEIGDNKTVTDIVFSDDFTAEQFANQAAGMNRRQMKDVVMESWRSQKPVDVQMVLQRKQAALREEFGGMLDFKEPEFGFDQIGGQEHFKEYCRRKVITPLKTGDIKTCSSGVLLLGPPGTGKSYLCWALAKEAGVNYLTVDITKVFGGLVGETEKNTDKLIEGISAASPCVVFMDEIDSVGLSRQSSGDSGTTARVFNRLMSFLSDPSRKGKVVLFAASNRPDLLDAAFIRPGRFDAILAILPPGKGEAQERKEVLLALKRKLKLEFHKELKDTEVTPNTGLGRLLLDRNHIWTGAEIEVVVKEALDNARYAQRTKVNGDPDHSIHAADINKAMDEVIANTGEIEKQTHLALFYVNHLGYCPPAWRDVARDKAALRTSLGMEAA
jgi:transitional endoplasmic reticulum ATPase